MKIRKSFSAVIVCLCSITLLQAQDITAKTSKPMESTVPPPGSKPALAPDLNPETKIVSKQPTVDENKKMPGGETKQTGDDIKPKILPAKNLSEKNSATSLDLIIPNTVLPKPIITNMSSTITTTAPVVKDTKKPVIIPKQ